jgi:predicted alpha/beta hydrolase family esterase
MRNDSLPLSGKHVVIVHGYTASPQANWFPWLAQSLASQGAKVSIPPMPDPHAPVPAAWADALRQVVPCIDPSIFFVGHSVGCIAILQHLLAQPVGTRAGGYVLVSGFDRVQVTLPELEAFTTAPLDYADLRHRARHRASVISTDDAIVDPEASRALAVALDTQTVEVANAGHFLDREGFTELPSVLDLLSDMARQPMA